VTFEDEDLNIVWHIGITDRKTAEDRSQRQNGAIYYMAESVVIFDSNGRVLIANKTWIELNRQIGFKTGIR